jgi:hypothetical protein
MATKSDIEKYSARCVQIEDMLIGHRIGGPIGADVSGFILRQVSMHLARPYIRDLLSAERA